MQSIVSKRGRTVIPALIRKRYGIQEGDRLVWLDDGQNIRVIPTRAAALEVLRGRARGESLLVNLLASRADDSSDG